MAKKCNSCGFTNNPNGANCCGKCGKDLNPRFSFWNSNGSDRYKVYDSYSYTCLPKSQYDVLKNAQKEVDQPLWKQQVNLIKKFWKYSTSGFWEGLKERWKEDDDKWEWLVPCILILGFVVFAFIKGCVSDTKQLSRIKIDDKYGIGYSEGKMLIPAIYDSISPNPIGNNQWFLYDLNTNIYGLAYVNDSIQNVIPTEYGDIVVGGDLAILKKGNNDGERSYLAVNGLINNKSGYKSLQYPGRYLSEAKIFIVRTDNSQSYLMDKTGHKLSDDYSRIKVSNDSVIIASNDIKSYTRTLHTLYDYEGNKLTDNTFTRIRDYSDGVAWCTVSENDAHSNKWTLIDNHGNTLFSKYVKYTTVKDFNDGLGWYQENSTSKYVAIDKQGRELFKMDAYQVYPFTMGVAPVYKGTTYSNKRLGFVNSKGEIVIPFKYQAKYSNPEFDKDSLMDVRLDGVEGKLHRNGKFIPK